MRKLWLRLAGAFLAVALVAVIVVALVMNRAVEVGFRGYVVRTNSRLTSAEFVGDLESYYAENGSWDGVTAMMPSMGAGQGTGQGQGGQGQGQGQGLGQGMMGAAGRAGMMGGAGYVLYDSMHQPVAGTLTDLLTRDATRTELASAIPLTVDGETVGWLLVETAGQTILDATQAAFVSRVRRSALIAALLAGSLALIIALFSGRLLAKPLQRLTEAAQSVAAGNLGQQVPVPTDTPAEIAALSESFNLMSSELAEADEQRQRLTADIAHELRTPLSVMRGQLQAMLDGVYPTDTAHIAVVYEQTLHLARLVDDLHTLSRAETGHLPLQMALLKPADLVKRASALFAPLAADSGLSLTVEAADDLPSIRGDADRLQQVLGNLLSNALRHTPSGGAIRLAVAVMDGRVRFSVTNSGAGLTPEQAAHVFERFWRADESRRRDSGGAGLGLAIASELIHLHGGKIWAEPGTDQTRFAFDVPAASAPEIETEPA